MIPLILIELALRDMTQDGMDGDFFTLLNKGIFSAICLHTFEPLKYYAQILPPRQFWYREGGENPGPEKESIRIIKKSPSQSVSGVGVVE